eukprot:1159085-Pelagomonas_calceolata.AAC.3
MKAQPCEPRIPVSCMCSNQASFVPPGFQRVGFFLKERTKNLCRKVQAKRKSMYQEDVAKLGPKQLGIDPTEHSEFTAATASFEVLEEATEA